MYARIQTCYFRLFSPKRFLLSLRPIVGSTTMEVFLSLYNQEAFSNPGDKIIASLPFGSMITDRNDPVGYGLSTPHTSQKISTTRRI